MRKDYGIEADYYRHGIELGILSFDQAISWADRIIEVEEDPAAEIIELALSSPRERNGVLEALGEIKGMRKPHVAGAMLLRDLYGRLKEGESIKLIAREALNVAWATKLPEEIRWEFDHIDDDISLAEQGIYSDLEGCERELEKLLAKYMFNEKT